MCVCVCCVTLSDTWRSFQVLWTVSLSVRCIKIQHNAHSQLQLSDATCKPIGLSILQQTAFGSAGLFVGLSLSSRWLTASKNKMYGPDGRRDMGRPGSLETARIFECLLLLLLLLLLLINHSEHGLQLLNKADDNEVRWHQRLNQL